MVNSPRGFRLIPFADGSYFELLALTHPDQARDYSCWPRGTPRWMRIHLGKAIHYSVRVGGSHSHGGRLSALAVRSSQRRPAHRAVPVTAAVRAAPTCSLFPSGGAH